MRILVIGSKGFIGQHCVSHLLQSGHLVSGCDVVTDYEAENYFLIDAVNSDYNEIFTENSFDVCVNCSGAAEVSASIKHPLRDFTLNTMNVFKLLDAIRIHQPLCRFLNLSSAAVYGNPQYLPIDEAHQINPISPYGFHKLAAEKICQEFTELFAVKTCNLRIFSAYGLGLKKQLFWDLYAKTRKSYSIELFGTGNESRDFIYIDDLLQAIEIVILNHDFDGSAINIANGKEVCIKDATQLFYDNYNKILKFNFSGNTKIGDPINWKADISKLRLLGYKQKISFEEGIKRYITWLKEEL